MYEFENPEQEVMFDYLKNAKIIAVVGISDKTDRSSFLIAQGLQQNGYHVIPVNPRLAGRDFIETDADIFWAQLGLQSQEAEQILREAGRNKIVMNRCIKIEYAYSGLGKK